LKQGHITPQQKTLESKNRLPTHKIATKALHPLALLKEKTYICSEILKQLKE
jgi:hypothetical protein